jgi:hypothetical protein
MGWRVRKRGRSSMRFKAILLSLCLAASPALADVQSLYTSLQDCVAVGRVQLPTRELVEAPDVGIRQCKGVGAFTVFMLDEDPRSFLALESGGHVYSLEQPMAAAFPLGQFPNVAATKLAEWRVDGAGKPQALIVRVSYLDADTSEPRSTLMVFNLRAFPPQFLGYAARNEEARILADR